MCEAGCAGAHVIQHAECTTLDKPDDDKPGHHGEDDSHGPIVNPPKTCVDCIAAGRSWQVGQVRVYGQVSFTILRACRPTFRNAFFPLELHTFHRPFY